MNICINCGVELDEGLKKCPLCGRDPGEKGVEDLITDNKPSNIINLQKKENLRYLWELFGIIAFSGITVCTILDLLISQGLRWSLFSDISIIAAWIIITLFLVCPPEESGNNSEPGYDNPCIPFSDRSDPQRDRMVHSGRAACYNSSVYSCRHYHNSL
ncbi:MAG: hypothetical protein MZV63_16290 [Marinilabiliales bacterium]|nr:hypothetical protein [Marinilabiliales bacterium]